MGGEAAATYGCDLDICRVIREDRPSQTEREASSNFSDLFQWFTRDSEPIKCHDFYHDLLGY